MTEHSVWEFCRLLCALKKTPVCLCDCLCCFVVVNTWPTFLDFCPVIKWMFECWKFWGRHIDSQITVLLFFAPQLLFPLLLCLHQPMFNYCYAKMFYVKLAEWCLLDCLLCNPLAYSCIQCTAIIYIYNTPLFFFFFFKAKVPATVRCHLSQLSS